MLIRPWSLLKETVDVLLEGAPKGLDAQAIETAMAGMDGAAGLHHLHVWQRPRDQPSLSAHLVLTDGADADGLRVGAQSTA